MSGAPPDPDCPGPTAPGPNAQGPDGRGPYIHGTSPDEQDRLALMNGILNGRCLAALSLAGGERVLELGAGTGIFAAELARAAGPAGRVVAVERDPAQLAAARERAEGGAFEARAGDAGDPPLREGEWGSFDLAHARFLLEHVPRPGAVVDAMARAVRPGGRVALVDDDHSLMRFWPEPEGMGRLWLDYAELYGRLGNDPYVGRRLVSLLVGAGLTPVRTAQIDYGACAGEAEFAAVVDNLARVVGGAREALVEGTDWSAGQVDGALADFRAWARRPDAAVWYALPLAVGVRAYSPAQSKASSLPE